jgi:hypothetical protein
MARVGQFFGTTISFGEPLAIVHPPDNDVARAQFDEELWNEDLSLDVMQQLQDELNDLYGLLILGRDATLLDDVT